MQGNNIVGVTTYKTTKKSVDKPYVKKSNTNVFKRKNKPTGV